MSTRGERVCVWCIKSGIYVPTSSLDSLRTVLALTHLRKLHLKTLDVSTAFMYAPVEDESCDLVMLLGNITTESRRGRRAMQRVICKLLKAMNGLRRAPLLWFKELLRKVNSMHKGKGTTQTFEPTLFRLELWPGSVILLLVYVDDLLLAASTEEARGAGDSSAGCVEDQGDRKFALGRARCLALLGSTDLAARARRGTVPCSSGSGATT